MLKIKAKHVSGLDDKAGRRITFIEYLGGVISFKDYASEDVARLQASSVKRVDFTTEKTTGGLLRREKEAPRLVLEYQTKSGAIKTLYFEPASMEDCQTVFGRLQNDLEQQQKRAAYLNGREERTENIHVRGESFYKDSFDSLKTENSDFDLSLSGILDADLERQRIYQFEFFPRKVELRPEPDNEHDPNAVAVLVDGYQVGHVPHGSCSHVKKVLAECEIEAISAKITGGKYKYVYLVNEDDFDEDEPKKASDYDIDIDEAPNSVVVTIKYLK